MVNCIWFITACFPVCYRSSLSTFSKDLLFYTYFSFYMLLSDVNKHGSACCFVFFVLLSLCLSSIKEEWRRNFILLFLISMLKQSIYFHHYRAKYDQTMIPNEKLPNISKNYAFQTPKLPIIKRKSWGPLHFQFLKLNCISRYLKMKLSYLRPVGRRFYLASELSGWE